MSFPIRPTHPLGVVLALVGVGLVAHAPASSNAPLAAPLLPGATRVKTSSGRVVVVERAEEQILITVLSLNGQQVTDNLPVYPIPGGVLVPLGEFCRLLQFAIEVDSLDGRAKGWFIDPKRTFVFDALTGTALVNGRKHVISPKQFEVQPQDIFVDVSLLEAWFPIRLAVDLRGSTLLATAQEKLPIQAVWERNAAARKDLGKFATNLEEERKHYRSAENPYGAAEVPAIDQTFRLGVVSTGVTRRSLTSTTLTSGDFLGMEHQAYLGLSNQVGSRRDFRMSLGRKDPAAGLFGSMRATQFQVGDILGQGADLVLGGSYGPGFSVTNAPLLLDHRFDRRTFRGNLAPGWHVELYHNTALLGLQAVRPDGTYEFTDVPMYFGANEYKLVFYGPQGEKREQVYRSDVNPMQVPAGDFRYRAYAQKPDQGGQRALTEAEYGLASGLSVGLAAMTLDLTDLMGNATTRHSYSSVNLRGYTNHLGTQYSVARMDNGKLAQQFTLQTGLGFSSLTFRQSMYQDGYRSEILNQVGLSGPLRRSSDLTVYLHGSALGGFNALSTAFGARSSTYAQGVSYDTFYHRLSMAWSGLNVSNDINWTRARGEASLGSISPTRGILSLSRSLRSIGLRSAVGYSLSGRREITDYTFSADYHLAMQDYLNLSVVRQNQSGQTTTALAYQRQFANLSLGTDLSYTTRIGWQANFNLRTTFVREPRQGRWSTTPASSQSHGAISALAYVDTNNNGVRDAGEPVKSGVGFTVNGFQRPMRTNAEGIALIPDVQAGTYAFIRVDNASLEDPLWRSTHPGLRIVSRTGHAARVELPVVALGEVDGNVLAEEKGTKAAVSGVLVELLDTKGQTVRQVRSAFDGYFIFQDIAPGTYTLRVHPEDAAKRRVVPGPSRTLIFHAEGSLLDGQNLSVKLLPAPKPLQEVPEGPEAAAPGGLKINEPPTSGAQRLAAMKAGDLPLAKQLSQNQLMPSKAWLVRVELASQASTIQQAAHLLAPHQEKLLLLPHAGGTAFQLVLGPFHTKVQAEAARKGLPSAFFQDGKRPFVVSASHISSAAQGMPPAHP